MSTAPMLAAGVALSFVVILGCATAAGELLELAERHDGSTGLDRSITAGLVARRSSWLTTLGRAFSTIGSQRALLPIVAIATLGLLYRRRLALAGLVVVIWAGAIGLYSLVKDIVGRPRPPADIWLTSASGSAFPSGHATQSLSTFAALALVIAVVAPKARRPAAVLAVVLAAGVGWSRVYLGVHWASDVVAGWLMAAAWVAVIAWLAHTAFAGRAHEASP
jgi:membrane-associated phospholipid phosphatase